MSTPRPQRGNPPDSSSLPPGTPPHSNVYHEALMSTPSGNPIPTYAAFSPTTLSSTTPNATSAAKRTSTILVHQKSPLLLATPPQITRALAYSHPFILILSKLAGLLSWTTGDPWESFLVVVVFWTSVLYGDIVVRVAGPVVLVLVLIGGMYARRFSPLSSSGRAEPGLGPGEGSNQSAGEGKNGKTGKKPTKHKNLPVDAIPETPATPGAGATAAAAAARPNNHQRSRSSVAAETTSTRHQKTLDEMVETLREFTTRCNILLEPLLELTDFLSTQRTPTSATTRPALTALFVRILLGTPFWFALTLPPLRVITTRRVILVFGTVVLTWHARVVRVSRAILWRSATVRWALGLVTGLRFDWSSGTLDGTRNAATSATAPSTNGADTPAPAAASGSGKPGKDGAETANGKNKPPKARESELSNTLRRAKGGRDGGVRFTFILYENQRRWLGLGWTSSLFAYERAAWTDEHNNSVPPRERFELPEVDDGSNVMRWRWVDGGRWRVDGVPDEAVAPGSGPSDEVEEGEWDYDGPGGRMGWVYYDNKWQNGRRGQDGWGRWTRRRKWYRDAELVEIDEDEKLDSTLEDGSADGSASSSAVAAVEESRNSEDHTPTPHHAPSTPPPHINNSQPPWPNQQPSNDRAAEDRELEDEYDSASLLSTSSRSSRLRSGSALRMRSGASVGSGSGGADSVRSHSRRLSEPIDEEDAAALTTHLGLAPQDAGREGESWGVGDELRMGLE